MLAVDVVETQHQVRVLTPLRMLVWDYRVNQWGEWTITDGVHACMFGGRHVYLSAAGSRTPPPGSVDFDRLRSTTT